jgi:hypothetical protein
MARIILAAAIAAAMASASPALRAQAPDPAGAPRGADPAEPAPGGTATTGKRAVYRPLPPPAEFAPPVLSLPDAVHDWGTAYRGEVIEHTFVVANKGGAPLSIQDVKPNCGCTLPKGADYRKLLPPGGETQITLSVDTSGLKGAIKKYAEVLTNVQGEENKLWMQGQVEELLVLKPSVVQLQVVRRSTVAPVPTVVEMTANLGKKVHVASVTPGKDLLTASLKEIEAGQKFEVTLVPNLRDEKNAFLSDVLETRVEVEGRTLNLRLPVSITLRDRIDVTPAKSVYFTQKETSPLAQPGAAPVVKELQIQSIGGPGHEFKVVKAESKDKLFSTTVEPIEGGKRYKLVVALEKRPEAPATSSSDGPRTPQRFVRDTIQVSTDDPEIPVIVIPAMARF